MTPNNEPNTNPVDKKGMGCLQIGGLMLLTIILSVAATVWFLNYYLFPKRFEPVELSDKEETILEQKLERFQGFSFDSRATPSTEQAGDEGPLTPEPYSEVGAKREVGLSERELNAILAKNTDLADKVAIDLSERLVSAKLRIPLDPDFPMFGGKTLKARAGVEFAYEQGRPVVVLKGVSVMGVPIPNAWLGGLKNIDLVREFGHDQGFWKSFADGVENIEVVEGRLKMKLKE